MGKDSVYVRIFFGVLCIPFGQRCFDIYVSNSLSRSSYADKMPLLQMSFLRMTKFMPLRIRAQRR